MSLRRVSRVIGNFLVSGCLLGSSAAAQEIGGAPRGFAGVIQIEGRGAPSERIEVVLQRFDRSIIDRFFSDSNGNFEIRGLSAGSYRIVISHSGYQPIEDTFDIYPRTGGVQKRFYALRPLATYSLPLRPDALSVQSLRVPKEARKWYSEGEKELAKGKYDAAASYFRRALDLYPQFAEALHAQGLIHLQRNEPEAARASFEKAITADPQYPGAYFALGSLLNRDNPAAAIRSLAKGLGLAPNSWRGCFELCRAHFALKAWEPAEKACQRARDFSSEPRVEVLITLGNIYLNQKRYSESLREFETFLKIAPKSPVAPQARAVTQKLKAAGIKAAP